MRSRPRQTPTPIAANNLYCHEAIRLVSRTPAQASKANGSRGTRRRAMGRHPGGHRHRQLRHGDRAQHWSRARLAAPGAPWTCRRAGAARDASLERRGRRTVTTPPLRRRWASCDAQRLPGAFDRLLRGAASRCRWPARATTRSGRATRRQMARPENRRCAARTVARWPMPTCFISPTRC